MPGACVSASTRHPATIWTTGHASTSTKSPCSAASSPRRHTHLQLVTLYFTEVSWPRLRYCAAAALHSEASLQPGGFFSLIYLLKRPSHSPKLSGRASPERTPYTRPYSAFQTDGYCGSAMVTVTPIIT